jgi:hypothetical protein
MNPIPAGRKAKKTYQPHPGRSKCQANYSVSENWTNASWRPLGMAIAEPYYSIVSRSKYSEANTTNSKRYREKTHPQANTAAGKHYLR